jgi:hypothetical protein
MQALGVDVMYNSNRKSNVKLPITNKARYFGGGIAVATKLKGQA